MGVHIDTIALGVGNSYIIRDNGAIAIDGGNTNKKTKFIAGLKKIPLKPEEIEDSPQQATGNLPSKVFCQSDFAR